MEVVILVLEMLARMMIYTRSLVAEVGIGTIMSKLFSIFHTSLVGIVLAGFACWFYGYGMGIAISGLVCLS